MGQLIVIVLMFAMAVIIGAWRQMNSLTEIKDPFGIARAWRSRILRISTWFLVAAFSIVSCYLLVDISQPFVGEFISRFIFGVALYIRWQVSMLLGFYWLTDDYKKNF